MTDVASLAALLPFPTYSTNKYARGKLIVCGGSKPYPGAVCLTAHASQVAGAGYTEVFTHQSNRGIVQRYRPSLVVREFGQLDVEHALSDNHPGAFVVGPGVDDADPRAASVLGTAIGKATHPVLVDGGCLHYLGQHPFFKMISNRAGRGQKTVLTPHFGEAKMLAEPLNIPMNDQRALANDLAEHYHAIVVLKGPETVISDGERFEVIKNGTAALAKAGTGDVLSGFIGAFLAQGIEPFDAALLGVALHANAGRLAADVLGPISVCAEDVIAYLPKAIYELSTDGDFEL